MNSPYLDDLRNKEIAELREKVASLGQQLADARANPQVPSGWICFAPTAQVREPLHNEYALDDKGEPCRFAGLFGEGERPILQRIDGVSPMPADEVAALRKQGEHRRIEYFKGVIRAIEGHVAALGSLCLPIVEVKPEFVCRALLQIEEQLTAQKFELAQLKSDLEVARACKPDEYTLLRSCERACQSDLAKAKNVIAAADKLAEGVPEIIDVLRGSQSMMAMPSDKWDENCDDTVQKTTADLDAYLALRQPQNGDTDGNPSR